MKVTTYIAEFLVAKGIDVLFELQGGMITRIIDEIHRLGRTTIVSVHHEQAAAFAVDAYARVTNKPGVALATSGPGATNLITGIASCYFDSVPAIFITGQVNQREQKGAKETRQIGFQETEIVPIVKPITKAAISIESAKEVPKVLQYAYRTAMSGRPGPVLIDVPMNLQHENAEDTPLCEDSDRISPESNRSEREAFISQFLLALESSEKPLVLAGRGIQTSNSKDVFLRFVEQFDLPVVTSLLGFDSIHYDHPDRVGFIGTYGNRWANFAMGESDLLLVLGSRLDLRQTGAEVDSFVRGKKIFHVDIDQAELNNRVKDCTVLCADVFEFLNSIAVRNNSSNHFVEWRKNIGRAYRKRKDIDELRGIQGINPNVFIHRLSAASSKAKIVTTDVGNNQMWASQSYELRSHQRFLSSGGMGAMGYSLPAAIGACFACGRFPVVAIAGDGGFQVNIQELQTIRRNNLPIKIVILNNRCLGMIRQFQDSYFESCYQSTVWGYNSPDFETVARAYGIDACSIETPEEMDAGLLSLWNDPDQPFLLNVSVDVHTNVYPKMMFGSPLTEMEPKA